MPMHDDLIADLTDAQREAVEHAEGPLLILAAAGSGKTRVITRRIAMLIAHGVPPWRICALTFTNKAAAEMRERVEHILGAGSRATRGLTIMTFHSLCARLLRRYAEVAQMPGLRPDYVIYDASDQAALMKRVIGDIGLNSSNWPPRAVLGHISGAKNALLDAAGYAQHAHDFSARTIARIYTAYERALRRANAVDFDDLLMLTVRMLQECEQAREEVQDRWRHLMIDEYQDTNQAQLAIATALVGRDEGAEAPNICVVGDPDQSIYAWRGADISNILEFERHFPGARVIALGENFRSTAPILAAADTLIKHNTRRKDKPLFTRREGGERVEAVLCADERHEAALVADWLKRMRDGGGESPMAWRDMAVFYRTNALSRVVEDALRAEGVAYVVARGTAFYDREEVRDALAYLRVLANPADDVSLRRVLNKPARGIGGTTAAALESLAASRGLTLLEALRGAGEVEGLTTRAVNAIGKFIAMYDGWREGCHFMGEEAKGLLRAVVERVVRESGLEGHYAARDRREDSPGEERTANLAELVSSAAVFEEEYEPGNDPAMDMPDIEDEGFAPDFGADIAQDIAAEEAAALPPALGMLRAYLERVALVADADAVDPERGAVTLMTLHAAKGLEFKAVAVVGLEEGLLPHSRAQASEAELEEERRLLFVGMTRAMERLLLTSARYRTVRGMHERTISSRFLDELPSEQVVMSNQADVEEHGEFDEASSGVGDWSARVEAEDDSLEGLRAGLMVRHPRFGLGRVEAIVSRGATPRVRIKFRDVGEKTIILGYAPLEVLE